MAGRLADLLMGRPNLTRRSMTWVISRPSSGHNRTRFAAS